MIRLACAMVFGGLLTSCSRNPKSDFKVGKLDTTAVKAMIGKSIVNSVDTISGKTYYVNKADGLATKIIRNKTGQIVAMAQSRKGVKIFISEYYPNGQQMGDIPLTTDGKMTGVATFYYANGKVRCTGRLQDGVSVGEWRYYDGDGNLVKKDIP